MIEEIRTPDCPRCGYPPRPEAKRYGVYICSKDECEVFTWDPRMTLAELREVIPNVIDLDEMDER